jgi:hypothetical protein
MVLAMRLFRRPGRHKGIRLITQALGKDSNVVQFSDSVRVNTLRKMLDGWEQKFGTLRTNCGEQLRPV